MAKSKYVRTFIIYLIGGVVCIATLYCSKNIRPLDRIKQLNSLGIYEYPKERELKSGVFDSGWIEVTPLQSEDINQDFSNIQDLNWLESIAKKNKVFLFGENHYYKNIHNLRNRILFTLNTFDYYHLISLELPYSFSEYFDHYVKLNDEEAKQFLNTIHDMITFEEDYFLLEHIRRWNLKNPNKIIHIATHDVEHDFNTTLKRILIPYFIKIEPELSRIDADEIILDELLHIISSFRDLLKKAKKVNLIGEHPFITTKYIENVVDNLESEYKDDFYGSNNFRQLAIIRNLTNDRFLGKFFKTGKVMFYAGYFHTPTNMRLNPKESFLREGAYLNNVYPATKDKTYSLKLEGYSYKIGKMHSLDFNKSLHSGRGYKSRIILFQQALKGSLVDPNYHYNYYSEPDDFNKLLLAKSYEHNHQPLLIKKIDWNKALQKSKTVSLSSYKRMKHNSFEFTYYDGFIFIPQSPIISLRPKKSFVINSN